jgi:hypothetical protein
MNCTKRTLIGEIIPGFLFVHMFHLGHHFNHFDLFLFIRVSAPTSVQKNLTVIWTDLT